MHSRTRTILFLDQFGQIGGGQRILLDLAAASLTRGWRTIVLCPDGPLGEVLRERGVEVHLLPVPPMQSGRKSLLDMIRWFFFSRGAAAEYAEIAEACDLMVVNGLRTLEIARRWARDFKKPAILYLHSVFRGIPRRLISSFLKLPHTLAIAPSPLVAEPFHSLPNVRIVPNWISQEFTEPETHTGDLRKALTIDDAFPIILVPGRFSPNKGQLLALEAFRRMKDQPCHLVFAGAALFEGKGAAVERELRNTAENDPAHVHVIYWEGSLPTLFDGADLVIVPSVWEEPFGLTAIEAMARGKPLVVTNRGMLPLLAGDGRFAEVAKPDADRIAAAMRDFFTAPDRWKNRAAEAKEHVRSLYAPEKNQAEVFAFMEQLISV